jgi:arsenate reductase (thioredoxin)
MRSVERVAIALLGCAASLLFACGAGDSHPVRSGRVLFVCEHGSAKSVIAAAVFNARAAARKVPFRAEARGVAPDPTLMPAAVAGLRADGLAPGQERPTAMGRADVDRASLIIAFDPLPPELTARARVVVWNVPPVSVDYATSRDAMLSRIDALLDELAPQPGR